MNTKIEAEIYFKLFFLRLAILARTQNFSPTTATTRMHQQQQQQQPTTTTKQSSERESLFYTTWPWVGTIYCALGFDRCDLAVLRMRFEWSPRRLFLWPASISTIQLQFNPSFKRPTAQSDPRSSRIKLERHCWELTPVR